ncbi:hypothetical protein MJO29_000880 [Puccinia striiformis f. sp. tritici]|nr:hypothetical protein MJO29_000880 [Puccinia striiformis f. sp. tritici]
MKNRLGQTPLEYLQQSQNTRVIQDSEVDSREAPKACPLRPFVQGEIENRMSMFGIGTRACCPAHHARSLWWTEGQSCAGPSSMATTHVVILDNSTNH